MKRLTQRQWLDAMNRAVELAGKEADVRYGIKKKTAAKAKPKVASKATRRVRAAAE